MKKEWIFGLSLMICSAIFAKTSGIFTYANYWSGIIITDCDETVTGTITIPDAIDGQPVSKIGDSAFFGCQMDAVVFPVSLEGISPHAFAACRNLKSVSFTNLPNWISDEAFDSDCEVFYTPEDPFGTTVGKKLNFCLKEKKNVDVVFKPGTHPNSGILYRIDANGEVTITKIDRNISGTVIVPDEIDGSPVTKIGAHAFVNCCGINKIILPAKLTYIEDCAFLGCHNLEEIRGRYTKPPKTETGFQMFQGCPDEKQLMWMVQNPQWKTREEYSVADVPVGGDLLSGGVNMAYAGSFCCSEYNRPSRHTFPKCATPLGVAVLFWDIPGEDYRINGLRLNLGFSHVGAATGIDAGFSSLTEGNATGIQLNLLNNFVGGNQNGIQIGLFNSIEDDGFGVQFGALNHAGGSRMQAGIINFGDSLSGVQLGVLNYGGSNTRALQLGFANSFSGYSGGWQIGGVNVSRKESCQVGVVNVCREENGRFQAGLLNVGKSWMFPGIYFTF